MSLKLILIILTKELIRMKFKPLKLINQYKTIKKESIKFKSNFGEKSKQFDDKRKNKIKNGKN